MLEAAQEILLSDWEYRAGKAWKSWVGGTKTDRKTQAVQVPHCWNAAESYRNEKAPRRGWGSYRVAVELDHRPAGAAYLISEGFFGLGDVWINGKKHFTVNGNFVGFRFRIDPFLKKGRNWICLRLHNKHDRRFLPGVKKPDFMLFGGLAGRVWLKTHETEHFQPGKTRVLTEFLDDQRAQLEVTIPLCGDCRSATNCPQAEIRAVLIDAGGDEVARDESVAAKGQLWLDCTFEVKNPIRWDVENPYLYQLNIFYLLEGKVIDEWHREVGFRSTEWRPEEGFFLNGRRLPLRGVSRYESMPGLGNALSVSQHRRDAQLIKDTGFNLVRLAHGPQHPEFLRACDDLGILVYAEIATYGKICTGRWLEEAKIQLMRMVQRDAYHASIILWGIGNQGRDAQAFTELSEQIAQMDHTRPTIYAENDQALGVHNMTDVMGLNFENDAPAKAREAGCKQVLLVTAMGNVEAVAGDESAEQKQVQALKAELDELDGQTSLAGWIVWSLCDYATPRAKGFVRHSGLYDAQRQPKAAAQWMRDRLT